MLFPAFGVKLSETEWEELQWKLFRVVLNNKGKGGKAFTYHLVRHHIYCKRKRKTTYHTSYSYQDECFYDKNEDLKLRSFDEKKVRIVKHYIVEKKQDAVGENGIFMVDEETFLEFHVTEAYSKEAYLEFTKSFSEILGNPTETNYLEGLASRLATNIVSRKTELVIKPGGVFLDNALLSEVVWKRVIEDDGVLYSLSEILGILITNRLKLEHARYAIKYVVKLTAENCCTLTITMEKRDKQLLGQ